MSAVSSMMVGDLPPNSSVTEVRCLAAAAITILPTAGEPVKKMWSNGSASSAVEVAASPSKIATSSSVKHSFTIFTITAVVCGVISLGFKIAVLPAEMADTSGTKQRFTG